MKQWVFLIVLILAAVAALNRPVYTMPSLLCTKNDFENANGWSSCNNVEGISDEKAYSGRFSSKIDKNRATSYVFNVHADKLPSYELKLIKIKARVYAETDDVQLSLVSKAHVKESKPFIFNVGGVETTKGKWVLIESDFNMSWIFHEGDEISAYFVLENASGPVYIDDMEVSIY